jgi:phage FluMu protein Com
MLINGCKTLIIRCKLCGRLGKYDLNLFNLAGGRKIEYKCECGDTNISIQRINNIFKARINCFNCGNEHFIDLDLNEMLKEDNMFYCIYGGELFFIGSKEKANQILLKSQNSLDESESPIYANEYFNNIKVFSEALKQLYLLSSKGKVNCDCGKSDIQMQLFPDRLELKCNNCKSVKIIFAETEEDLSILMKKDKISLRKHNISCIDSIKEKNKDIKE